MAVIRFDVEVNGELYCRAGLEGHGVVSVGLDWIDFDGEGVTDDPEHVRSALGLRVSGHRAERPHTAADVEAEREPPDTTPVHWGEVTRGLKVGDEVRIRIVEAEDADPPVETPRSP